MKRTSYPSDLTDSEYAVLAPLLPARKAGTRKGGRPAKHSWREILNAIRYTLRSGCAWRLIPHDLPPWQTAYDYFRQWKQDGTWVRIHDSLRGKLRQSQGRARQASAAHSR